MAEAPGLGEGAPAPRRLSLEQEPPAAAIKRFAMLDSSTSESSDGGGGEGDNGAATGAANRFDKSKLDWSALLNDSDESTPAPPPQKSAAATLAARLSSAAGTTTAEPEAAQSTSAPAAVAAAAPPPASSFRALALINSDSSVEAALPDRAARPSRTAHSRRTPDKPRPRSRQGSAPRSFVPPPQRETTAAARPLLPERPPTTPPVAAAASDVLNASVTSEVTAAGARTAQPSPVVPAPPAVSEAPAEVRLAAAAAPPPPPPATTAASVKRSTPQRPAAIKTSPQPPAEARTKKRPAAAPAEATESATAAAAASTGDVAPLSPGMVYSTVPKWTKGMKKKNGVYVASKVLANPTGLYERGLKRLQRAEERREELRAKLDEEERSAMTFHPVISPRAHAMRRSARTSGDNNGDAADADASQQLRHRLQLLELPEEALEVCRRSPRICGASEKIVRECRERGGGVAAVLPPGERLYQDFFFRQQAVAEAREVAPPPALVRSQREIDAHVAELYEFEQHRQLAIAAARDAPLPLSPRGPQPTYVDPHALVQRLTRERQPSPRRVARAQREADPCTFHPQVNTDGEDLVRLARHRGLQRWAEYLCGSAVVSVAALLDYVGPASREAQCLAAELARRDPAKASWTVDELTATFTEAASAEVERLWRRRPAAEGRPVSPELTFRPALNGRSAALMAGRVAQDRCGPTHDRLFLTAKARQLTARQAELEAEQAALEAEQHRRATTQRHHAEWRAKEQRRLAAYRAERTQRQLDRTPTHDATLHITAGPPQPLTQRLPSTSPERPSSKTNAMASPAPSKSPVRAASYNCDAASRHSSLAKAATTSTSPLRPPVEPTSSLPEMRNNKAEAFPNVADKPALREEIAETPVAAPQSAKAPVRDNSEELHDAADALRRLLGASRPHASSASSQAAHSHASSSQPQAHRQLSATPIVAQDINRPRDLKEGSRHVDVVLECATLRDLSTVACSERSQLERAQKRQLRELGRLLYNRSKTRVDDH